ncbi:unnamed protein product, partial [Staurois parvus]
GQIPRITPGIQDREVGLCRVHTGQEKWTVQSPYIQNKDRYRELHQAYRTGEVGLCRVHTYRIITDTENYTRHTGQVKWDCAESIHTE